MSASLIQTNDLDSQTIEAIFEDASQYLDGKFYDDLKHKLIITLFFENSTRTKSSFEIAAKRLGASVVHLDVAKSSTKKGETLFDTAANLDAMGPDAIIVRHATSGVPKNITDFAQCSIVNAGDGNHAHPTQALLDLFTIRKHFSGNIQGKKIAIVGDIKNSRVASSNMELLARFGLEVILVAPEVFMPQTSLRSCDDIREVIDELDIIMSLRTQTERHDGSVIISTEDYAKKYCITKELMGDRDILLLHPGPVHRNIDISDEMLLDPRAKVLEQVTNGVAVRMAVLKHLILANG